MRPSHTRPDEDAVLDGLLRDWVDLSGAIRERGGCGTQLHSDGRAGDWIDYVLARPSLRGQARGTDFELLRNRALDDPYSDHHGLFVTVELQQAPRRRAPLLGLLVDSPSALSRRQWLLASIRGALDLGAPADDISPLVVSQRYEYGRTASQPRRAASASGRASARRLGR